MSTVRYCDMDDCQNSDYSQKLFRPLNEIVAEKLVKRNWGFCKYDLHICESCVNDCCNEVDEQLKIIDEYWIDIGKDWDKDR